LHPVYRRLLTFTLEELHVIEDHLGQLDQQMADLLAAHHDAIAEVGATAATFPSPKQEGAGAQPANSEVSATASNFSELHRAARHERERFSIMAHPCGFVSLPSLRERLSHEPIVFLKSRA